MSCCVALKMLPSDQNQLFCSHIENLCPPIRLPGSSLQIVKSLAGASGNRNVRRQIIRRHAGLWVWAIDCRYERSAVSFGGGAGQSMVAGLFVSIGDADTSSSCSVVWAVTALGSDKITEAEHRHMRHGSAPPQNLPAPHRKAASTAPPSFSPLRQLEHANCLKPLPDSYPWRTQWILSPQQWLQA